MFRIKADKTSDEGQYLEPKHMTLNKLINIVCRVTDLIHRVVTCFNSPILMQELTWSLSEPKYLY
jgi:hypothetical protein